MRSGGFLALVVVTIAALILAAFPILGAALAILGRWTFTRSVEVDRSYHYRLIVNLAYKGEPLTFDIVVGCRVRLTTYRDNDRTNEVGIAPMVYGLRMEDGHGVVVRPPEACDGETTENGRVPASVLPLIVTYENADEPWFGLAYTSDEAYENPNSELKFFNATINRATRAEWEERRRTQAPKNFVTYQLLGINESNRWQAVRWHAGMRMMGSVCQFPSQVKLPEPAREIVRPNWPDDRPKYWYANEAAKVPSFPSGRKILAIPLSYSRDSHPNSMC